MTTQSSDGIEFDHYLDPEVIESTAGVYEKIMHLVTEPEWLLHAPLIHEINQLKQQAGAVVLAHNYQPVEIFYGIADITGDSLGLARAAAEVDEDVIVMCGIRAQTDVEAIAWDGHCVAHEAFHASDLRALRLQHPGIAIIAHPECTEEVQESADWVGSTSGLLDYLTTHRPKKAALITECTMSDNVSAQLTDVELIQPCSLCPYMKRISLENTAAALRELKHEILLEASVVEGARRSVERMLAVSNGAAANPC